MIGLPSFWNSKLWYLHTWVVIFVLWSASHNVLCGQSELAPIHIKTQGIKSLKSPQAMVSAPHPEAAKIGLDILKAGGNAMDAAIAVQFALAVCLPIAGNIGGGGFLVYWDQDSLQSLALDYRETAPSLAHRDMYLTDSKEVIPKLSTEGIRSVGVPGTVDGMYQAFLRKSRLRNWKQLVQPAIELARRGFPITAMQAKYLNDHQNKFAEINDWHVPFLNKSTWKEGDLLIQNDLAQVLSLIRDRGRSGFYEGSVSNLILDEMRRRKGLMTAADLRDYRSVWREPIRFDFKGYTIHSMPPPSSGGIALAQMFGLFERLTSRPLEFLSADYIHLLSEIERRAYADRNTHLGDPDFISIPTEALLSKTHLDQMAASFDPSHATPSNKIQAWQGTESEETTHYNIIDTWGNSVAVTTTLNGAYGSKVVVQGGGFFLNNEMDDFSIKVGEPNLYGLIGGVSNEIQPKKRMLSSMTPTLVTKDQRCILALGTPGGSTIITSVFQVLLNILHFSQDPYEAVSHPRFHHQWYPDAIQMERRLFLSPVVESLKKKGHQIIDRGIIGRMECLYRYPDGSLGGGADFRGDNGLLGY